MARRAAWIPRGPRRSANGFTVPSGAQLPRLRSRSDLPLVIGRGAHATAIEAGGMVTLCAGASCGPLTADHGVVIGANCTVERITAGGTVVIQGGARIGAVTAGADVILLGDCAVGDVNASGDIVVVGTPTTGKLRPRGRLTTRQF